MARRSCLPNDNISRGERLSWFTPLVFLVLIVALRAWHSTDAFQVQLLVWAFNSFFLVAAIIATILAGRAFLAGAPRSVLALGCGMLMFGLASFCGMALLNSHRVNEGITAHNIGNFIAGVIHLLGAASMIRANPGESGGTAARWQLRFAYAAVAIGILAISGLAAMGWLPAFIHDQATTTLRLFVLALTSAAYLLAALLFAMLERRARSELLRWYWLGLVLMAIGIGATGMTVIGSSLSWIAHAAQAAGLLYVLSGLFSNSRRSRNALADAFRGLQDSLRESEGRYRALFGNSIDGILFVADRERILAANPAACDLFRLTEPQLLRLPLSRLFDAQDAATAAVLEHHDRIIREEIRCVRADAQHFDAEISTVSLQFDRRHFVIIRDITRRKRAEEAHTRAKEAAEIALRAAEIARAQAQHASASKDQFIAALSHELRTPLTPVLAAASSLKNDPRLPEDVREDFRMMQRNVGLEVQLIADLLDVTRVAANKLVLDKRPLDVARVLRDASRICATELDARNQSLAIHAPGAPFVMLADEPRLHQVFWNLVNNASKFTPPGGSISITAERHTPEAGGLFDQLVVRVTDTGCGIDPDTLSRLFIAFEQANEETTRQFGGLGLGLAICKAVVELHGGSILADSPGRGLGATFTVELPLATGVTTSDDSPPSEPQGDTLDLAPPAGDSLPALRILLVEDHLDTARIMRRLLSGQGHRVTLAACVREALEEAGRAEFDLLLSDLGLPDGNGHDLLRQLIAQGKTLRAVALSGYGSAADILESKAAGFCEHLTKPVNFQSLNDALLRASAALRS